MSPITRVFASVVGVALVATAAATAPSPPAPLTLQSAVERALQNHPRLQAAQSETRAAQANLRGARALANPFLAIAPGISGPGSSDEEISLVQPLELNGVRRHRTGRAKAAFRATSALRATVARGLVLDVQVAYYALAGARSLVDLHTESVASAEELLRITRRHVEEGLRPGIDLVQVRLESRRSRQLLEHAQGQALVAETELNTWLARPVGMPIGTLDELEYSPYAGAGAIDLEQALGQRPELVVARQNVIAAHRGIGLARSSLRPDVAILGRVETFTRAPRDGGVAIGLTLPFLDYGAGRHRVRQARAEARAREHNLVDAENEIRRQVRQAIDRLRVAERIVQRYQSGMIEDARRLAEAQRKRFQAGLGSPLEILEAQRTFRLVLGDYALSLAAYQQAIAALEWAMASAPLPAQHALKPTRSADDRGKD